MSDEEKQPVENEEQDNRVKVRVAGRDVFIDPENLKFNEATLNQYMEKEGALYNFYGQVLADAQAQAQVAKLDHDVTFAEKFKEFKAGASDKLAESAAKCDPDVVKAYKKVIAAQRIVELLKNHLRAWDKNHDNAQSLGHMIRKEMDKLGFDIKYNQNQAQDYEKLYDMMEKEKEE